MTTSSASGADQPATGGRQSLPLRCSHRAIARWRRTPSRLAAGAVDPLLIASAGAIMLWWTWGTWPDVMIDFGRELYVPWRLTEGEVLYRDIAYLSGPLSPHLNALWFSLFGVSLRTLFVANLLVATGIVALLYRLMIGIGSRVGAITACVFFVVVFACLRLMTTGNYNYLAPYSHEITHGCALALISLWALLRYQRNPRPRWIVLAGVGIGLTFLTKPEMFLAAVVGVLPAWLLTAFGTRFECEPTSSSPARVTAILFAAVIATVLCAWGLLGIAAPLQEVVAGTFDSWRYAMNGEVRGLEFYRWRMGLDAPAANVAKLLMALATYVAVLAPPTVVARVTRKRGFVEYAVAGGVFVVTAVILLFVFDTRSWLKAGRPLPALMLLSVTGWGIAAWRSREDPPRRRTALLSLAMSAFAFTLLLKMALNAAVSHYGFVLAMPAALVVIIAMLDWIPRMVARRGGSALVYRAAALAVIAVAASAHVQHSRLQLRGRHAVVGQGADRFKVGEYGRRVGEAMDQIASLIGPGQTMAVLPEGVMMNYLLRRENPTGFINIMPPEWVLFGGDHMLEAFRRDPPDLIVYVAKNTAEYGLGQFATGYGSELWEWIATRYRPARWYGPPGRRIWLMTPSRSGPGEVLQSHHPTRGPPGTPRVSALTPCRRPSS